MIGDCPRLQAQSFAYILLTEPFATKYSFLPYHTYHFLNVFHVLLISSISLTFLPPSPFLPPLPTIPPLSTASEGIGSGTPAVKGTQPPANKVSSLELLGPLIHLV